jgi:hypothetical protein
MHMPDFYFEQLVTEAFLDQVFDWAEQADLAIRQDIMNPLDGSGNPRGAIHRGGEVTPTAAPSMSVEVSSMVGTDPDGRRVYWAEEQTVDCTVDYLGSSAVVAASGNERYLGIFAEFDRELTEERIDGNGVSVFTQQLESFAIKVYAGEEVTAGTAVPPATPAGKIRLANIKLTYNQTQILTADIEYDTASYLRDDWVRLLGSDLDDLVQGNPYKAIEDLYVWLDTIAAGGATFTSSANWHDGSDLISVSMVAAVNEIVSDLAALAGSDRIGAAAYTTTNGYCDLSAGSIQDQLRTIAGNVDGHINGDAPAHPDTAVTAASKGGSPKSLGAGSVGSQVTSLLSWINEHLNGTTQHADTVVTSVARAGSPSSLSSGTVGSQLTALLGFVNDRARKASIETISSTWTHTSNLIMNSILRLGDGENYYIRGDGDTSTKYYTFFRPNGGRSRLLYSGSFSGSIIWTYNCYWDHTSDVWDYDTSTSHSWALRLSSSGVYLQKMDLDDPLHTSSGWTDTQWSSTLRWGPDISGMYGMPIYPSVFNVAGNEVYDRVRVAMAVENQGASADSMNDVAAATWHGEMNGIVSGDVTLTQDAEQNWDTGGTATAGILEVDDFGCIVYGESESIIAGGGVANWRGTVEVELTV